MGGEGCRGSGYIGIINCEDIKRWLDVGVISYGC